MKFLTTWHIRSNHISYVLVVNKNRKLLRRGSKTVTKVWQSWNWCDVSCFDHSKNLQTVHVIALQFYNNQSLILNLRKAELQYKRKRCRWKIQRIICQLPQIQSDSNTSIPEWTLWNHKSSSKHMENLIFRRSHHSLVVKKIWFITYWALFKPCKSKSTSPIILHLQQQLS